MIKFFFLYISLLSISLSVFSQANYVTISREDYEEYDEIPIFTPDARISGDFKYTFNINRGEFLQDPDDSSNDQFLDFGLKFSSEVHRNLTFNLAITNKPYVAGSDENTFYPQNKTEQDNLPETQQTQNNLIFDEANLDYEFTPNLHLVFGLQEINPGDDKGLLYRGKATGITLKCGLGTWCLEVGFFQIGQANTSIFNWAQISYPVFEDGVEIEDLWNPGVKRSQNFFLVDFYQAHYNNQGLPLAKDGFSTWDHSVDSSGALNDFLVIEGGQPVYFDNFQEIYGLNISGVSGGIGYGLNYILSDGSKTYYQTLEGQKQTGLGRQNTSSSAVLAELHYTHNDSYRYGIKGMTTSGNDTLDLSTDEPRRWEYSESAYFEVHKGSYGDALFYFDGYDGYGQGLSISNLTFWNLYYSYRNPAGTFGFDLSYYAFEKTKSVLNESNKNVERIGEEWDIQFRYNFEKSLVGKFGMALFSPGEAFAFNGNEVPKQEIEDSLSLFRISLEYNFR